MTEHGVVLFHTTSAVMRAEKLLVKEGHVVKLIPTPREFSSDCGIALRFDWSERGQIGSLLHATGVEFETVHRLGNK